MNDSRQPSSVGWVSPSGRNPTNAEHVGLRDETANPTYGASPSFRKIIERDKVAIKASGDDSAWPLVRLGDYCDKIGSGATPKGGKEAYLTHGPYRLIRSQNIYNDGFKYDGLAFISNEQAKKLDGVSVEENDVLLNITGDSVARVCSTPKDVLPARVNQHVAIIRPSAKSFDPRFIRYFLSSPQQQDLLLGMASAGATRNALTKAMIKSYLVPKPPLEEQHELADVLASLDDKIALLRETNATLEAIAQAIFKSWFVDFDPVRAKMEGREPEGLDADTAALFPDSFEDSELGEIPRGWRISKVGDVIQIVGGGTPSTKESGFWEPPVHHWVTPKDLSGLSAPVLLDTERKLSELGIKKVSSGLLPEQTLLLSSRAPIGYLAIARIATAINQGFIAILPHADYGPEFWLLWCRLNMEAIKQKSNGSTFMEISKSTFRTIPMIALPPAVAHAFNAIASPIYQRIAENERLARTLADSRDALLPRLMSGKIVVTDSNKYCESGI